MFRRHTHTVATAAAVLLAIGATSLPAAARTTVAFAGRAQNPADAECFSEFFGTMTNVCSESKVFYLPVAVDASGDHTGAITAYGETPNNDIACVAIGINKEATAYWGGVTRSLPKFGEAADITPLSAYVPPSGSLFFNCIVDPRGRINLLNYSW
jgi:hypothetical protein